MKYSLQKEQIQAGFLYFRIVGNYCRERKPFSHSAVIARELGVPTIVGVPGGVIKKLKTGQNIELNASLGEIRILQ